MKRIIGISLIASPFVLLACVCVWAGWGLTGLSSPWGALGFTFGIPLIISAIIGLGIYLMSD